MQKIFTEHGLIEQVIESLASRDEIEWLLLKIWMNSNSLFARYAAFHVLSERSRPVKDIDEDAALKFVLDYSGNAIRDNDESKWIISPYVAFEAIRLIFLKSWNDVNNNRRVATQIRDWLKDFVESSDKTVRDLAAGLLLEHLFQTHGIAEFFSAWEISPVAGEVYQHSIGR
jgi:hypothetical protein